MNRHILHCSDNIISRVFIICEENKYIQLTESALFWYNCDTHCGEIHLRGPDTKDRAAWLLCYSSFLTYLLEVVPGPDYSDVPSVNLSLWSLFLSPIWTHHRRLGSQNRRSSNESNLKFPWSYKGNKSLDEWLFLSRCLIVVPSPSSAKEMDGPWML